MADIKKIMSNHPTVTNPIDFCSAFALMDPDERDFMLNTVLKPSVTILEYGSGGSTIQFPKKVKKYYSIEHHPGWYERIAEDTRGQENLTLILEEDRKKYVEIPKELGETFDVVLVDGIDRLECALFSFDYLKDDGMLLVHDSIGRCLVDTEDGSIHPEIKEEFEPLLKKYSLNSFVFTLSAFKKL